VTKVANAFSSDLNLFYVCPLSYPKNSLLSVIDQFSKTANAKATMDSLPARTNGTNTSRGSQASPPPKGIYVPVPTFFAKEGTSAYDAVTPPLDLETQTEHSLFLVRGGIKGLVILGSTGEAIFLRSEERKELIASQRKALDDAGYKDRPIIAGTATQQIDDTLQLVKESKEAGAEYAMVLGPGYFAPATSQEGIRKWFEAIADRSALPVMM